MKFLIRQIITASLSPLILVMSGCASGLATRYDDPSDVCRYARLPLIQTEAAFNQSIVSGAAIGAGIGALTGALAGGNLKSAAIGAGGGLLAGASAGYAKAKIDQAHTREQLQASVDADAERDLRQLNGSVNALSQLIECRNSEIAQVAEQYSARTITRQEALAHYRDIDNRMLLDDKLIAEVLGRSDERASAYVSARSMSTQLPPEPSVQSPQAASNATFTLVSVQKTAVADQKKHRMVRSDLEKRIADINAVVGEREIGGQVSLAQD